MIPICITHEANAWHWSSCFHLKPHIQSVMEFWCLDFYRDFTWLWIALEHWRIMYYDMSSPLRRASVDYLTRCTSLVITRHSLCPSNTYRWAWLVTTPFTPQSQTSTRARKGVDPCAYVKAECYTKSALGNRNGSFFFVRGALWDTDPCTVALETSWVKRHTSDKPGFTISLLWKSLTPHVRRASEWAWHVIVHDTSVF